MAGSSGHALEYSATVTTNTSVTAAIDRLVELGHREIGTVQFASEDYIAVRLRLADIRAALDRHGLALSDQNIRFGSFTAESGYEVARQLLQERPQVTAIMAGNDTIALGVLAAAAQLGRKVPGDLSLVGFDDLPFSAWLSPALSTIRIDAVRVGEMAADLLIRLLRNDAVPDRQLRLPAEFVDRASIGPSKSVQLSIT